MSVRRLNALLNVTGPLTRPCLGDGYSKDARQKAKHGSWPSGQSSKNANSVQLSCVSKLVKGFWIPEIPKPYICVAVDGDYGSLPQIPTCSQLKSCSAREANDDSSQVHQPQPKPKVSTRSLVPSTEYS